MGFDLTVMQLTTCVVLMPLLGSIISGLGCQWWSARTSHLITISGVSVSWLLALCLGCQFLLHHHAAVDQNLYTWAVSGVYQFQVGWLVDNLSVLMMLVVTTISLLVHIYSIGYMHDDPDNPRFFSYVSLFTFAMLALVSSNNLLVMFFGWEGVGLVSYLLIGFWFHKDTACAGSMKAFIVNRVGDLGFLLGIAWLLKLTGTLHYAGIFTGIKPHLGDTITLFGHSMKTFNWIAFLLFVGAMGKSAQIPLHVWLPESMEGPTPISALIHAATMVTAGIFMMSRLSPVFVQAPETQGLILLIGASGAFFLGLIGLVQNDIKRVVAYSTLSQLGYMVAACGAGAYQIAMFHLVTHAFFKALLFLGAGSVIVACHHEQDMRKMGGLAGSMPVTYFTFLIGSLALIALPPFAGFYSKDAVIAIVNACKVPGATYAYACVLLGALVTALYSARSLVMTFYGRYRGDCKHVHESAKSSTIPLVVLAIASVVTGFWWAKPMLIAGPDNIFYGVLDASVFKSVAAVHIGEESLHPWRMAQEAFHHLPGVLGVLGIFAVYFIYCRGDNRAEMIAKRCAVIYRVLVNKYGFDQFYSSCIVTPVKWLAGVLYHVADMTWIDGWIVNGSAKWVARLSSTVRWAQSGYVFHYALVMMAGLGLALGYVVLVK